MSKSNEQGMIEAERVPFYQRVRKTHRVNLSEQADRVEKKLMTDAVNIMNETHRELSDTVTELRKRLDRMEAGIKHG